MTAVLALGILVLVADAINSSASSRARKAELRSKVWPAERAATLALLKTGQQADGPTNNQRTIELKPFVNAALAEWTGNVKDNTLEELPSGIHTFGGVAFDVEGRIQLAGGAQANGGREFPMRVHIPISGRCSKLEVLHGAVNLRMPGKEIARLVLQYEDGSNARFEIIGGKQVLDWWGPIYNTDAGKGRHTTGPDTELAWAGENPGIRRSAPDYSLRLYKSTFVNPHPDLKIIGIDYLSTLSGPASFLLGLTLEQESFPSTKL